MILARTEQRYLTQIYYKWGSIKIVIRVVNKDLTYEQRVPVKGYLPQEVRPEDIIEKNDPNIGVDYDAERELYFVFLPTTPTDMSPVLPAGGWKDYEITVNDVWTIREDGDNGLQKREQDTRSYFEKLKEGTPVYKEGSGLVEKVAIIIDDIRNLQKKKNSIPVATYMSNYRDNKEKLDKADKYIDALKKLANPELADNESPYSLAGVIKLGAGAKGASGVGEPDKSLGITAEKSWLVILIVLAFLGILSAVFFFIWQSHLKRSRVSPELAEISPESVQMPEVGKSGEEPK